MALTKITANIIEAGAIDASALANTSITADKLHTTLDLTGKTVTVATATAGDNDTTVASTAFVSTAIANLADSAPATLDTLNELAAALGDDANFSTTVTNSIALKAPLASPTFTGTLTASGLAYPTSDGTNGQVLTTDGAGTISFASVPAGYTDSDVETYLDGGTSTPTFSTATVSGDVIIASTVPRLILSETDVTNGNWDFRDSFGNLKIRSLNDDLSTAQDRIVIGSNGDIGFYDDTGTSQGLYWDASTESLGIGTTSPDMQLEVAGASGSSSTFKLSGRPDWTSGNGQYNVGNIYGENLGAGVNTTRIKLDGDDVSGSMRFYTANSGTLTSAMFIDNNQDATFYGSTTIPLGDRYYGQIKARSDMYVTSYGGGAGNTNKGLLVSGGNTNENSWVFIDSANSTWGIYHRNTDSTETYSSDEPLRPNSIAWVGQGRLSGYFTLENKNGGVTTQASYVRGGLAGVYHEYKFKSDSGFEIGKGDDGEPVHTPTINERSSATNAVDSTVGNGGPGVYWLNFNSKRFRAYVRPNWLQGRNWVLAAKWFSATDMPSGSAYWSNDDYHNEGDFNPYSGLWSKYLSWRYFSFNRLAMQMGDRIAPIMQFSSSQTLYGAFSGGRANNGGGVSPTSTDPALSTGAIYHSMTNYMGPNFTDLGGLEDKMQSYGLNKWANSSTNSTSANNNGSADLNSNVSQGFQLTVEDAHKNIGGIPSQGVAGAWIGCPLDEGNCNPLATSSNGGADSGFGFGTGGGNSARTSTSGIIEWSQGNRVANYFPAYVWLSID
jgi:hypothetical protein